MSQAPGPGSERIGGVHVEVRADIGPLKAGLQQAKAETQKTAAQMQGQIAGAGAASSAGAASGKARDRGIFGRMAESIRDTAAPLVAFNRAIGGVLGLLFRVSGIIGLVVGGLSLLKFGFDKLTAGSRETSEALEKLAHNLERIRNVEAGKVADILPGVNPERFREVAAEIDKLVKRATVGGTTFRSVEALELAIAGVKREADEMFRAGSFDPEAMRALKDRQRDLESLLHQRQGELSVVELLVVKERELQALVAKRRDGETAILRLKGEQLKREAQAARLRAIEKFDRMGSATQGAQLLQALNVLISQREGRDIR